MEALLVSYSETNNDNKEIFHKFPTCQVKWGIEIYERLVFQYAKNFYKYRKLNTKQSIIEMRKCIGVMKLVSSYHLALTFEEHLENILRK